MLGVIRQLCHVTELAETGQLHPLCIWRLNATIYHIFSNLIRTGFCRFLKRKKKLVRGSNPHLSFNRATCEGAARKGLAHSSFRSRAVGVGCMEGHSGEHYRRIFQKVLRKQCCGHIRNDILWEDDGEDKDDSDWVTDND